MLLYFEEAFFGAREMSVNGTNASIFVEIRSAYQAPVMMDYDLVAEEQTWKIFAMTNPVSAVPDIQEQRKKTQTMTEIRFEQNLLHELEPTVKAQCLVITMDDLMPQFGHYFASRALETHCVLSIERQDLEDLVAANSDVMCIVALGGGQAIDAAKYCA